jgi:hypothetical protein
MTLVGEAGEAKERASSHVSHVPGSVWIREQN